MYIQLPSQLCTYKNATWRTRDECIESFFYSSLFYNLITRKTYPSFWSCMMNPFIENWRASVSDYRSAMGIAVVREHIARASFERWRIVSSVCTLYLITASLVSDRISYALFHYSRWTMLRFLSKCKCAFYMCIVKRRITSLTICVILLRNVHAAYTVERLEIRLLNVWCFW